MCGIAGYISFSEPAYTEKIQVMLDGMLHRGPDDQGSYQDNKALPGAALGHRRLSILDLSQAGRQPMTNEDQSLWIVLNGEIYNYQELRKDLAAKGHQFQSATDTEAVLHLYEDHGTECVKYLRGMFAFAIWDSRSRTFFMARDRVGKKPLYYALVSGGLYFASEIQALYQIDEIKRALDYTALDLYLAYSYIPSPYSIYKEIRKLPPASTALLKAGQLDIQKYWSLDFVPKLNISFEEAKGQLLKHLEEAVRIRLYSDVPLGCFLSGGVDSSAVVALMSRLSSEPVKTFSIGFPDKKFDETSYARQVASYYNTDHHEFMVEPKSMDVLPDLVKHYGEPYADSSALPTWYLSAMTREHVTVALNGDGGDESFAGYNWYGTASSLASIRRFLPASLAGILQRMIPGRDGYRRKARRLMELLAQQPDRRFADLRTEIKPWLRTRLYTPELRQHMDGAAEKYLLDWYAQCKGIDQLDHMLFTDVMSYLPEELLVKVDRATMAHSLEARSPLLDHELMEFAARLPSEFKLCNGRKKYLLQEAVAPLLPKGFLDRPKMGFSVPLKSWFQGELKPFAREKILGGKMAQSGLFDIECLDSVVEGQVPLLRDAGSLVWRLLVLAEWMEQYS